MIVQMPWWGFVLMLLGGIAVGAGVAVAIVAWRFARGMNW